ncbi:MAG: tetratricopeptide repeat protein, partial [Halanaerobium sp.]|nr:tetratricopeptide repeat protein [Halanaerobium sp.]
QAIREYQRAAKLAEKPEYLRSLRDVLYELQRWSEALPWAEKIMELEAVEAEDYFVLGEVYTRLYNPILAREAFEKAIEMDDDYIKAWERVYWIYLNLAEEDRTFLNKALNAAVKLVNLSPQEYEFHNYLGDVYLKLGRNDDAFQEYQKALELSPGNGWGYIKMARYYQAIDQNQLARQLYKKAVQVTGEWWSYEAYGNFLLEQKDYLEAVKALQAAHNLKPERVEISLQLGEAFLAENKPEKALQAWQEALQYAPGDIYTYLRVGRVMEEHGFAAEAEKVFQDASKLFDPGGPGSEWQEDALGEIYYFLGRAEYERGNLQQAIDYFQDGYPDLPHAGAVFLLGRYYLAAGELSAARQTWENCLQKAPDNRWLKTGLGLLNLACGNLEGAEWYFIGLGDDGVTSLLRGWRNLKPYEGLLAGQGGEEAPLAAAAARLKEGDLSGALEGFNLELQSDSHSLEAKLWKVILYSLTDDKREDEAYQALVADTANTDWSRLAGAFRQLADRIFQARIVLN